MAAKTKARTKTQTKTRAKTKSKTQTRSSALGKAKTQARSIDEYLAGLSEDKRVALENIRRIIKSVAPKATESISYQIAAFKLNGMLVGFGATANHCAFYVMSPATMEAHRRELAGYDTSKGTIRFQAERPLPATLVRKLVKARIAENSG